MRLTTLRTLTRIIPALFLCSSALIGFVAVREHSETYAAFALLFLALAVFYHSFGRRRSDKSD